MVVSDSCVAFHHKLHKAVFVAINSQLVGLLKPERKSEFEKYASGCWGEGLKDWEYVYCIKTQMFSHNYYSGCG
jgi:hypothetical protein